MLGDVVASVMAGLGLHERLREEEMKSAWHTIVGEFVAKHSAPQKLVEGVLIVRVLQPTLKYELDRVWKRDILAKLKTRFGGRTVRDLRFQIG